MAVHLVQNPFQRPDAKCDVVLYVENIALYVHEWVICKHSPVLKEMLEKITIKAGRRNGVEFKELELTDIKVESVIKMMQFLYTDQLQNLKEINIEGIRILLAACTKFNVIWLTDSIRKYILIQYDDATKISYLQIAIQFNFNDIKSKILKSSFQNSSFEKLQSYESFNCLCTDIQYKIGISRLKALLPSREGCDIIAFIDKLIDKVDDQKLFAEEKIHVFKESVKVPFQGSVIVPCVYPFEKPDESSDVVVMLDDGSKLFLSRHILCYHSSVFDKMLNGNFKEGVDREVKLPGKKQCHMVEFFKFFYPELKQEVNGSTNFKIMLQLCQEYQVEWLKEHINVSLLNHVNKSPNKIIWYLHLAEEYELKDLKRQIMKNISHIIKSNSFNSMIFIDGYKLLQRKTMYTLATKRLIFISSSSEEVVFIVKFLNNVFENIF